MYTYILYVNSEIKHCPISNCLWKSKQSLLSSNNVSKDPFSSKFMRIQLKPINSLIKPDRKIFSFPNSVKNYRSAWVFEYVYAFYAIAMYSIQNRCVRLLQRFAINACLRLEHIDGVKVIICKLFSCLHLMLLIEKITQSNNLITLLNLKCSMNEKYS